MKIYHNPRCRKSRETLQILTDHKIEPEIIEYLKDVPGKSEIEHILSLLGIKAEELVRKSEVIYKENYKGKKLTEAQWIEAMSKHPKLIERPIVIKGKKAVLGRPPENVLGLI